MSLAELVVVMAIFSLLLLILYTLMSQSVRIWHNVSGSETALLVLKKAQRILEADLLETSSPQSLVTKVPPSLPGGGRDGSAVWFLSAAGPAGSLVQKPDGTAFWQRNVLYYLVVPGGHTACAGGIGARGFDDCCPHKVLLRKTIDNPPPTDPSSDPSTTEETLLTNAEIQPYLTRPTSLNTAAMMGEPHVTSVEVVATNLLWFEVTRPTTGELQMDLRAVALEDASRKLTIGARSLGSSPFTLSQPVSVFPNN